MGTKNSTVLTQSKLLNSTVSFLKTRPDPNSIETVVLNRSSSSGYVSIKLVAPEPLQLITVMSASHDSLTSVKQGCAIYLSPASVTTIGIRIATSKSGIRSEERRVGNECSTRRRAEHNKIIERRRMIH